MLQILYAAKTVCGWPGLVRRVLRSITVWSGQDLSSYTHDCGVINSSKQQRVVHINSPLY